MPSCTPRRRNWAAFIAGDKGAEAADYVRVAAVFLSVSGCASVVTRAFQGFGEMLPVVVLQTLLLPSLRTVLCGGAVLAGLETTEIGVAWYLPVLIVLLAAVPWLRTRMARAEREPVDDAPAAVRGRIGVLAVHRVPGGGDGRPDRAAAAGRAPGELTAVARGGRHLRRRQPLPDLRRDDLDGGGLRDWAAALGHDRAGGVRPGPRGVPGSHHVAVGDLLPGLPGAGGVCPADDAPVRRIVHVRVDGADDPVAGDAGQHGHGRRRAALFMGGKSSWILLDNVIALAINVGLNLVLIPEYGMSGAAVAWAREHRGRKPRAAVPGVASVGPAAAGPGIRRRHDRRDRLLRGDRRGRSMTLGDSIPAFAAYAIVSTALYGLCAWRLRDRLQLVVLWDAVRVRGARSARPAATI